MTLQPRLRIGGREDDRVVELELDAVVRAQDEAVRLQQAADGHHALVEVRPAAQDAVVGQESRSNAGVA